MKKKYIMVYEDIISKIENKIYPVDSKLPSEHFFMNEYGVSRDTIRKALNKLDEQGYIKKTNGIGSFVLGIHQFDLPVSGIKSFKEVNEELGTNFTTHVKSLLSAKASAHMATQLKVSKDTPIWKLTRTRAIEYEHVILDKDYMLQECIPNLDESICEHSLYHYIENDLGLRIAYARKEITAQMASDEDYHLLDMKDFNMVIVVKSYTYLEDTRLFQYTESRHRPDKFVFVNFAKRE